mgnify:CR=1 FL=1
MKKLLLTASAALTILFAQAQTLCDPNMTYTIGSQYQLEIAIPVTGNSLPTMAPLYAVTYGDGNMLAEDSCFSGPCTHMVYNYNPNGTYYDTLTTCISYTLTDTAGYVDTLMCCFSQYWDGSSWAVSGGNPTPSWDCPTNMPGGCYDPGTGNGQYATLADCQAVCGTPTLSWDCDPVSGCYDPNNGLGQYTTLASCQSICQSQIVSPCDSIDIVGSQSQLTMEEVNDEVEETHVKPSAATLAQTIPTSKSSKIASVPCQGTDAYLDYLHVYENLCKLVNSRGNEGRDILRRHLNNCRSELNSVWGSNLITTGMGSVTKTTSKVRTKPRKKDNKSKKIIGE